MKKQDVHIIDLNFQGIEDAIACFLIKRGSECILIETGPHSSLQALSSGLEREGVLLEDIKHVCLTHIHLDHAGAAWALARNNTRIHLHPSGVGHMHNPEKLMSSAKRIYQDKMDELWGEMKAIEQNLLKEVDDYEVLDFNEVSLKAVHTPGHAIHHISWTYEDLIFTGDVGGVKIGKNRVVPPCPPPDINIEDWIFSINKLREEKPKWLYLTHFGVISDVNSHLDELEEMLWDWANWMKPKYERETQAAEIVPEFQKYVANQLREYGASEKEILKYETANPSWMSVSGLLRYWRKKTEQ